MSNYYLIARCVDTNKFKIIELKSKWYLKNGTDYLKRANQLEAIDLVTSRFKNSNDMAKRLIEKGHIESGNYDFFIVSKYKKDNQEKLKIQEVIYNTKEDRINAFRNICFASLNNKLKDSIDNVRLFDKFISKMYYDKADFNKIVVEGLSALPRKLVVAAASIRNSNSIPYNFKYKNAWIMDNYGISRSIIDTFNRYDVLSNMSEHVNYFNKVNRERALIKQDLLKMCDKNYVEGQVSLFDSKRETKEITKPEIDNSFQNKNYVINTLKNIDINMFENINGKTVINPYKMNIPITKEDEKILINSLGKRLLFSTYLYNFHRDKIKSHNLGFGDYSVLEEDLKADLKEINSYLKNENTMKKAYLFCLTYNKLKNKSCSSWDVKTYQKK